MLTLQRGEVERVPALRRRGRLHVVEVRLEERREPRVGEVGAGDLHGASVAERGIVEHPSRQAAQILHVPCPDHCPGPWTPGLAGDTVGG